MNERDINWGDPMLPPDYTSQHIDDDPPEEPREEEEADDQDTPPLPTTHEEVLQNLQKNGVNQNFLEREAHKHGIDYDERMTGEPEEIINNKNENG